MKHYEDYKREYDKEFSKAMAGSRSGRIVHENVWILAKWEEDNAIEMTDRKKYYAALEKTEKEDPMLFAALEDGLKLVFNLYDNLSIQEKENLK